MQFIQGDDRHETYFHTLIGQECNDITANLMDVFQFLLLPTRINYQVVISFNDAGKNLSAGGRHLHRHLQPAAIA